MIYNMILTVKNEKDRFEPITKSVQGFSLLEVSFKFLQLIFQEIEAEHNEEKSQIRKEYNLNDNDIPF